MTVTTYKHLMVKRKSNNEHPVFIGPCFIHIQRETQTYFSLLSSLIGKKNDLRDLKAYGSDGEVTQLNALVAAEMLYSYERQHRRPPPQQVARQI